MPPSFKHIGNEETETDYPGLTDHRKLPCLLV